MASVSQTRLWRTHSLVPRRHSCRRQKLKEENRQLREEINAETMYPFRESVRWKKSAEGSEDGPFCPICFASKKFLMPVRFRNRMSAGLFSFIKGRYHFPE
jgi:hypothetical protein